MDLRSTLMVPKLRRLVRRSIKPDLGTLTSRLILRGGTCQSMHVLRLSLDYQSIQPRHQDDLSAIRLDQLETCVQRADFVAEGSAKLRQALGGSVLTALHSRTIDEPSSRSPRWGQPLRPEAPRPSSRHSDRAIRSTLYRS